MSGEVVDPRRSAYNGQVHAFHGKKSGEGAMRGNFSVKVNIHARKRNSMCLLFKELQPTSGYGRGCFDLRCLLVLSIIHYYLQH